MNRVLFFAAALCALLIAGPSASAGFEFKVDSSFGSALGTQVPVNQAGFITVFVETTSPDIGASADTYGVNLEVSAFDGATLSDITLGAATNAPGGGFQTFFVPTQPTPSTYYVAGGSFPAASMQARTELFRIPFTVQASVPTFGKFRFTVTPGTAANPTDLALNGASLGPTIQSPAYFISAVPEPSSLALLGLPVVGLVLRRRRTA